MLVVPSPFVPGTTLAPILVCLFGGPLVPEWTNYLELVKQKGTQAKQPFEEHGYKQWHTGE